MLSLAAVFDPKQSIMGNPEHPQNQPIILMILKYNKRRTDLQ